MGTARPCDRHTQQVPAPVGVINNRECGEKLLRVQIFTPMKSLLCL
jgi:hypothetical protein